MDTLYGPIRRLLESDPYGALSALDRLPGADGQTPEAWALRASALHLLGGQHAAGGAAANALTCWEQAMGCGDAGVQAQVRYEAEDLCFRTASAWAASGHTGEALALVRRGLALVASPRLANLQAGLNTPPPRAAPSLPEAATGAEVRSVAFNTLPAPARRRFAACAAGREAPAPLYFEPVPGTTGPVVALVFGGLFLLAFAGTGFAEPAGSSYDAPWTLAVYAAALFACLAALFNVVARRWTASALPWRPGTYLFPNALVVAEAAGTLRLFPFDALDYFKCVHHSTNGRYTHSALRFTFTDGGWRELRVSPLARAEALLRQLGDAQRQRAEVARAGDLTALAALDPLAAGSGADVAPAPLVPADPAWRRWRAAIAAAAALLLAAPTWAARNAVSDWRLFSATESAGTEAAYRQYVSQGWLFVGQARQRLPAVAFAEAKKKGTVTALRRVLHDYPRSTVEADVRQEVHRAYEKSRAKFRAQAAMADRAMVSFMERLMDDLEARDTPTVAVRFRSPDPAALAAADERLSARARATFRPAAAIAPHFTDATSRPRESAIVDRLNQGFRAIFPADVLALSMGPRLSPGASVPPDAPVILIDYAVAPSGMIYSSRDNPLGPLFVGIRVTFRVSMRAPGATPFAFALDVAPPEHFTVEYTKSGITAAPFEGPPEGRVYTVMAERAFDELATKLRLAFFPASAAPGPARPALRR